MREREICANRIIWSVRNTKTSGRTAEKPQLCKIKSLDRSDRTCISLGSSKQFQSMRLYSCVHNSMALVSSIQNEFSRLTAHLDRHFVKPKLKNWNIQNGLDCTFRSPNNFRNEIQSSNAKRTKEFMNFWYDDRPDENCRCRWHKIVRHIHKPDAVACYRNVCLAFFGIGYEVNLMYLN